MQNLSEKALHIVSFDVPFPADYGGVIDIFYKIKALHSQGVIIHLHCFHYGREQSVVLEKYCQKVYYYQRNLDKKFLFNSLPYIVATRTSKELLQNLLQKDLPILFEGLHCCALLKDQRLKNRLKMVRMHNIEHKYYEGLAQSESNFFKRFYFRREAKKLKTFEAILHSSNYILAISPGDAQELSKKYKNVIEITAFHPNESVEIQQGLGKFALYHGNLEIGENNQAALFLVNKVFNTIDTPFIIAGKNPSQELLLAVKNKKHIQIKSNLSTEAIHELITQAQINILPTFQATGIKLKLLMALFNGRHCIVNSFMVENSSLASLCQIHDSSVEMTKKVKEYFVLPFKDEEKLKRENILMDQFSNRKNIQKLIELLG